MALSRNILFERLSFNDLLSRSEEGRIGRSDTVSVRPNVITTIEDDEAWTFKYKSSPSTTGLRHKGYIRFYKDSLDTTKSADDIECIVDCSCPDFRYVWAYADTKQDASVIGNKSYNQCINAAPHVTNPTQTPGMCKHLIGLTDYLKTKVTPPENLKENVQKLFELHSGTNDYEQFMENVVIEAPVDHYGTIGDFNKQGPFRSVDRKLISHPTHIKRVKDFFKNTTIDFDMYFVNNPGGGRHLETGEVDKEFIFNTLKIKPEQLKNGGFDPNTITIFFTNNIGDQKMPLTPWIIAHRTARVLNRWNRENSRHSNTSYQFGGLVNAVKEFISTIFSFYNYKVSARDIEISNDTKEILALMNTLGTFKSARDKNISRDGEFYYELFAQYLKNGEIKFNPLPDVLKVGHRYLRIHDKEDAEEHSQMFQRDFKYYAEDVLSSAIGSIFVM